MFIAELQECNPAICVILKRGKSVFARWYDSLCGKAVLPYSYGKLRYEERPILGVDKSLATLYNGMRGRMERLFMVDAEEREYLKNYDISKYDRPSVTADIAVFAIMDEAESIEGSRGDEKSNYRKDPERELQILLVKRGTHPYRNGWALPGGFSVKWESSDETARRELQEETGVADAYLRPFGVFSKPGRDPRGWIVSHGYLALIDGTKYRLHAGTDAWEAAWFRIEVTSTERSRNAEHLTKKKEQKGGLQGGITVIEILHELKLFQRERELDLSVKVLERKRFTKLHGFSEYEILEAGGLAFDHAEIILRAFQNLRREAESTGMVVFDLMPEKFTLNRLQRAFELILGRELLTANFRRKMAPLVLETEEEISGVGHRPAKLFTRNPEEFYV